MSRLSLLLLLAGCGEPPLVVEPSSSSGPVPASPPSAARAPMQPRPVSPPAKTSADQGRVLETMDAGGYTYARVDLCGTETWAAGPQTALKVDDTVVLDGDMQMHDFHSNTLDRTFASIRFVTGMQTRSTPPDCSGGAAPSASPHDLPASHPVGAPTASHPVGLPTKKPGTRQGKVVETMESGGYRYAKADFCGTETWVAGPNVGLAVGDTIEVGSGAAMHDFHSSTLDRTFAVIDFVGGIEKIEGPPDCG